ncbi:MAG: carbohydrate ABC transporter permease, partial [Lachnospiraceae bacterium]
MQQYKRKHEYTPGFVIWTVFKYVSVLFVCFCALLPIVPCVTTAFKTKAEYQSTNVMVPPTNWLNFSNFIEAFKKANMGTAFANSLIILVCVVTGSVLIGTSLAYVLNRFKFPGNSVIRQLFTFAALLPGIAMQVSVYEIMTKLHFVNNLYGYIIMMMGTDVISI